MTTLNTVDINLTKFGLTLFAICLVIDTIAKLTVYSKLEVAPAIVGIYFSIRLFSNFRKE